MPNEDTRTYLKLKDNRLENPVWEPTTGGEIKRGDIYRVLSDNVQYLNPNRNYLAINSLYDGRQVGQPIGPIDLH